MSNDECRTISRDVILDDGSENITYSAGWDSSPNDWATTYWGLTMQCVQFTRQLLG